MGTLMKIERCDGVWAKDREILIETLRHIETQLSNEFRFPLLEGIMPCGHKFEYALYDDIPHESVPYTCGNPRHYFVRYGEAE